jgi:AraC-like DNA-binding protein
MSNPDDAALRDLCARLFAEPQRVLTTLRHGVEGEFSIQPHTHPDLLQLDLLIGCRGKAWSESQWVTLQGVTALVAYPNEAHGYELAGDSAGSRVYLIKLRVDPAWPIVRRRVLPRCVSPVRQSEVLSSAMRFLTAPPPEHDTPAMRIARLAEMLCFWPRSGRTSAPEPQVEPWLAEALELIRQRTSDPPTVQELASGAGVSVRHFNRRFTARMGVPPQAHINARRLSVARQLLMQRQLKVRQIAQAVGFGSLATFSRWFTQNAGLTPRQFRKEPEVF